MKVHFIHDNSSLNVHTQTKIVVAAALLVPVLLHVAALFTRVKLAAWARATFQLAFVKVELVFNAALATGDCFCIDHDWRSLGGWRAAELF
jgi:hypothetical protein